MGNKIPIGEINGFLLRIKQAFTQEQFRFEERKKNIASLSRVGLKPSHIKEYILGLTYKDYLCGPEAERDTRFPPGDYFLFGFNIDGYEFQIKIKIEDNSGGDFCVCISFHIAERPNHYPYK
ncbi:MAG: hypothetical protein WA118_01430 [Carboxydocellales bacterium]